jgi:hypothetical protein
MAAEAMQDTTVVLRRHVGSGCFQVTQVDRSFCYRGKSVYVKRGENRTGLIFRPPQRVFLRISSPLFPPTLTKEGPLF